jgi:hypothetical protein
MHLTLYRFCRVRPNFSFSGKIKKAPRKQLVQLIAPKALNKATLLRVQY